jgi:hypothetical protein
VKDPWPAIKIEIHDADDHGMIRVVTWTRVSITEDGTGASYTYRESRVPGPDVKP